MHWKAFLVERPSRRCTFGGNFSLLLFVPLFFAWARIECHQAYFAVLVHLFVDVDSCCTFHYGVEQSRTRFLSDRALVFLLALHCAWPVYLCYASLRVVAVCGFVCQWSARFALFDFFNRAHHHAIFVMSKQPRGLWRVCGRDMFSLCAAQSFSNRRRLAHLETLCV